MRARQPDTIGVVERGGVRVGYEVFDPPDRQERPTLVLLTSWAIVHMRPVEAPDALHWPGGSASSLSRAGATVAARPARGDPAAYADRRVRRWTPSAVMDADRRRPCRRRRAVCGRAGMRSSSPPGTPTGALGVVAMGASFCRWPLPPGFDEVPKEQLRRLGQGTTATTGCRLPRLGRVLHVPGLHRAALDQAAARTVLAWGAGDRRGDARFPPCQRLADPTAADAEAICRAVQCPVLIVHGERDGSCRTRSAPGWPNGAAARSSPSPTAATACRCAEPSAVHAARPRSSSTRSRVRSPGPDDGLRRGSRHRRALFVSSAIGLRPRPARRGDRRELRPCTPTWRSTRSPSTPSAGARRRGRAGAPSEQFPRERERHVESEAASTTLAHLPAIRRIDRSSPPTSSIFHDVVEEEQHDLVIADEGWEIDYFLHKNPEQPTAVRVADRLRGLAADRRRRRTHEAG